MSSAMQQFGGLNDKTVMDIDYEEQANSGLMSIDRIYDSAQGGWTRKKSVTCIYRVWKRDLTAARTAIPSSPTNLTTIAGKDTGGSSATRISLGSGWQLKSISESQQGISFIDMSCKYEQEVPEAEELYPAGLIVTQEAGVLTIFWRGVSMQVYDNGLGVNGNGLEMVKLPQIYRTVQVRTTTEQYDVERYINRFQIMANSRVVRSVQYVAVENVITASIAYSGAASETTLSEKFNGVTYDAPMYWTTYTADETYVPASAAGNQIAELFLGKHMVWSFSAI